MSIYLGFLSLQILIESRKAKIEKSKFLKLIFKLYFNIKVLIFQSNLRFTEFYFRRIANREDKIDWLYWELHWKSWTNSILSVLIIPEEKLNFNLDTLAILTILVILISIGVMIIKLGLLKIFNIPKNKPWFPKYKNFWLKFLVCST